MSEENTAVVEMTPGQIWVANVRESIAEMKRRLTGLEIKSEDDRNGYAFVRLGISECRDKRVAVEKRRRDLVRPLIDEKKEIDDAAKEITAMLVGMEGPLKIKKKKVDDIKEARRVAKELAERAEREAAERARKAAEEAELQEMRDRIEKEAKEEREKLAAERAEQEAEMAEEKARFEAVAAEKKEEARQERLAEQKRIDAEDMVRQKEWDRKQAERAEQEAELSNSMAKLREEADRLEAIKIEQEEAEAAKLRDEIEATAEKYHQDETQIEIEPPSEWVRSPEDAELHYELAKMSEELDVPAGDIEKMGAWYCELVKIRTPNFDRGDVQNFANMMQSALGRATQQISYWLDRGISQDERRD